MTQTFKNFLIELGPFAGNKELAGEDAYKYVQRYCGNALNLYKQGHQLYRGIDRAVKSEAFLSPRIETPRPSAHTSNLYNTLMSNLESWKAFPPRNRSLICSTDYEYPAKFGKVYSVFPLDGFKLGICPEEDLWIAFHYLFGELKPIHRMNQFNGAILDFVAFIQKNVEHDLNINIETLKDTSNIQEIQEVFHVIDMEIDGLSPKELADLRTKSSNPFAKYYLIPTKVNQGMMKAIDQLLDPDHNGFFTQTNNITTGNFEAWTDSPCIMIEAGIAKELITGK